MILNHIKIAFRNLRRNKAYSILNITGLSIGMAVAMLIGFWIYDELTFDRTHKKYERVAQVIQNVTNNGEVQTWTPVPFPLADELRNKYGSDFKRVVLTTGVDNHILSYNDKRLSKVGTYAESGIPELFSMEMLQGSSNVLSDPTSILLSQATAKAFFGDADPINQLISIDNDQQVKVAGVYKDIPRNSSFYGLQFIAPWQLFANDGWIKDVEDPWRPNAFNLYVELADNVNEVAVNAHIKDAKLKNVNPQLAQKKPALFLHPMRDWHLRSDFKNGVNTGGRIQYVWMFGIIGIFVLLLACINFMNLSTARAEKRAKEVGIRKTIGSLRGQLIGQFFSESLVAVLLSVIIALGIVQMLLPFFNSVADKEMAVQWSSPLFWLLVTGFALVTGLVAGSYPALYLSSFRPIKVLKGTFKAGPAATLPRKVLVVVQFTVSIILIIATIVVFRQIEYAKDRPVGYDRNALVSVRVTGNELHKHIEAVRKELMDARAITSIAESGSTLTNSYSTTSGITWPGKDPGLSTDFGVEEVSYEFGHTIDWSILSGRDFSRDMATDSSAVVLNESAVKMMGLKEPVGVTIQSFGDPLQIIGVIKDIVSQSPFTPVKPTVYFLTVGSAGNVLLKLDPQQSASVAIASIEKIFKQFNPLEPFEYKFIDDEYGRKFGSEERVGRLAGFFAALAVLISCLGLFGMASFMAERRVKEIGIRKVVGASAFTIWRLLSKDFVVLLIISLLIAIPLGWYFMSSWLNDYAYHYTLAPSIFIAAAGGALLITLVTVSFHSIKAALMNPVKSLRSE